MWTPTFRSPGTPPGGFKRSLIHAYSTNRHTRNCKANLRRIAPPSDSIPPSCRGPVPGGGGRGVVPEAEAAVEAVAAQPVHTTQLGGVVAVGGHIFGGGGSLNE